MPAFGLKAKGAPPTANNGCYIYAYQRSMGIKDYMKKDLTVID